MRLRSLSNALTWATAAGSFTTAAPGAHNHHHSHHEGIGKRAPDSGTPTVPGSAGATYQPNEQLLSESEHRQSIENGSLELAGASTPSATVAASEASTVWTLAPSAGLSLDNRSLPLTATSSGPESLSTGTGLDQDFPDSALDCSIFPSAYGPIPIEWAQLGGWSGIQYITMLGDNVSNIVTANPGGICKPGSMCSYACPPGYQKSQWPAAQGTTGQSIGGLQCNSNGKLALTNPSLSEKLCILGTGAVVVHNKLDENAAICRTDYPGTEAEVIPLNTQPNSTNNLTCPDAKSYYTHEGLPTTAQYYINNQGVVVSNACTWSTDGSDMGNWAPSYLGVGQDDVGKTWLSIASTAQNDPSNYTALNYSVEITGDISSKCRLNGGWYCSGLDYEDCNIYGCTVELMSGQATYVLSD